MVSRDLVTIILVRVPPTLSGVDSVEDPTDGDLLGVEEPAADDNVIDVCLLNIETVIDIRKREPHRLYAVGGAEIYLVGIALVVEANDDFNHLLVIFARVIHSETLSTP